VVVGAVVGGTDVVVGATVVVVTGAVVVVVSWALAVPDRTPSRIGILAIARSSAVVRRETFGGIRAAYGQWRARQGTMCAHGHEKTVRSRSVDLPMGDLPRIPAAFPRWCTLHSGAGDGIGRTEDGDLGGWRRRTIGSKPPAG
jgi:hypothetical protein